MTHTNNPLDKSNCLNANVLQTKRALNDKEASMYIGTSVSWLRHGRIEGCRFDRILRLPFLKIGRSVRYLIENLDAWLEKFQKLDHLAQLVQEKFIHEQNTVKHKA